MNLWTLMFNETVAYRLQVCCEHWHTCKVADTCDWFVSESHVQGVCLEKEAHPLRMNKYSILGITSIKSLFCNCLIHSSIFCHLSGSRSIEMINYITRIYYCIKLRNNDKNAIYISVSSSLTSVLLTLDWFLLLPGTLLLISSKMSCKVCGATDIFYKTAFCRLHRM